MIESKKLLRKLTPKQEELIRVIRDEWTNLTLSRGSSGSRITQDNEIREGMCYLYKISSKILSKVPEHPRILIFDSYIRMQLGFNLLLGSDENDIHVILENDSMHSARRIGSGLALNDPVCVTMLSRVVGYPLQTSLDNFLYTRVYASLRNCVADPDVIM